MSIDYLNEAFRKLDLLEDLFDTSTDGIKNLDSFMDDSTVEDTVTVIDAEAETEDELSDSYVGKVIVNCNVCHSHIFKNKEDVMIDEDGTVNSEDNCPYCGETEGFTVIGEIAPFNTTDDASELTVDTDEITVDTDEATEVIEEGLFGKKPTHALIIKYQGGGKADDAKSDWYCFAMSSDLDKLKEEEATLKSDPNYKDVEYKIVDMKTAKTLVHKEEFRGAENLDESISSLSEQKKITSENETMKTEDFAEEPSFTETVEKAENKSLNMSRASRRIQEDFKEVSITTDDQHMEMTSDENGKVTVTTEPIEAEVATEETIVPVSAETEETILSNNDLENASVEEFDETEESEENVEDEFDIEDFDEEGMDDLGESYLRKVYENVESFKTTSVSSNNQTLIVEGVITFNSGAKKKTGFVFEAADANLKGQLRFNGANKQLTESANAFTLVGKLDNKKLFVESLKYNYKVNDSSIRGVVRRK